MATTYLHNYDDSPCDLGPSEDVSDPDSICGHGYNIHEVYVD